MIKGIDSDLIISLAEYCFNEVWVSRFQVDKIFLLLTRQGLLAPLCDAVHLGVFHSFTCGFIPALWTVLLVRYVLYRQSTTVLRLCYYHLIWLFSRKDCCAVSMITNSTAQFVFAHCPQQGHARATRLGRQRLFIAGRRLLWRRLWWRHQINPSHPLYHHTTRLDDPNTCHYSTLSAIWNQHPCRRLGGAKR